MRITTSIFVILLPMICSAQISAKINNSKPQGSYMIAAICTDGIVMITDSRAIFPGINRGIGAYYDESSKIYQYKDILLAMAGVTTFSKIYFRQLFNDFKKSHSSEIPVPSFLNEFLQFAKTKITFQDYHVLVNNQFLIVGYTKKQPYILWNNKSEKQIFTSEGSYKTNNSTDDDNSALADALKTLNVYYTLAILSNSIKHFIDEANKDTVSAFGGKLSTVIIKEGKIESVSLQTKNDFETKKNFISAYKNKQLKIWYRSKQDSISLRNVLFQEESNTAGLK